VIFAGKTRVNERLRDGVGLLPGYTAAKRVTCF
jgi:hypothetical protein